MATRCDCHWEQIVLSPKVETLWLRVQWVPGCPVHPQDDDE